MSTESEKSKGSHVATIDYDPELNEHVLVFGEDLINEMGWQVGDTLEWIDNSDGSWSIMRVSKDASKTD